MEDYIITPESLERVMKTHEIHSLNQLHWKLPRDNKIANDLFEYARYAALRSDSRFELAIPIQAFHCINWYLNRYTQIGAFLTLDGMKRKHSSRWMRAVGKTLKTTCETEQDLITRRFGEDWRKRPIKARIYRNTPQREGDYITGVRLPDMQIFADTCIQESGLYWDFSWSKRYDFDSNDFDSNDVENSVQRRMYRKQYIRFRSPRKEI